MATELSRGQVFRQSRSRAVTSQAGGQAPRVLPPSASLESGSRPRPCIQNHPILHQQLHPPYLPLIPTASSCPHLLRAFWCFAGVVVSSSNATAEPLQLPRSPWGQSGGPCPTTPAREHHSHTLPVSATHSAATTPSSCLRAADPSNTRCLQSLRSDRVGPLVLTCLI